MIVYEIDNSVYINLTNKCSNNCSFCVRSTSERYSEYSLWLKKEPTADEVIEELGKHLARQEYVFCGYGEPLYRFDTLIIVAKWLKSKGKTVRLNTNGQAEPIVGKGAAEKLAGCVDKVSISLNAGDAASYDKLCHCAFGKAGYESILKFASECKACGIDTRFSMVRTADADVEGTQKVADSLGIPLRIRELIK